MLNKLRGGACLLSFLALFSVQAAFAQTYRIQHQVPTVVERGEPAQLSFEVPGLNSSQVQDAFLYYRYDGGVSYQQVRADLDQNTFSVELEVKNESATLLEYYLAIETIEGDQIVYPDNMPQGEPLRVDIVEQREERVTRSDEVEGIDYTILSPEPGQELSPRDVLVAVTLFYEEGTVDTTASSFRLLLDGEDITSVASATEYFFSYAPSELPPGEHYLELLLQEPGDTLTIAGWEFSVSTPPGYVAAADDDEGGTYTFEESRTLAPEGMVQLTARNQRIGGLGNDVLKGNFQLSGSKEDIRYSAYGLLTSQESNRLQPQNRYGAEVYVGDWFEFQAGHIYPMLSGLSIAGRRVQGINTAFHVLNQSIHAQFLYGKMSRSISNRYSEVVPNVLLSEGIPVDTTYALNFEDNGIGTFKRNVIGGRLGFGRRNKFQWGLNLLKVRDDTTSINLIDSYNDLLDQQPELIDGLDTEYRNDLATDNDLLSINGNPRPKDNLVAGSDLSFNLMNNRIRFRTEGAVSLLNENITGGVLTSENNLGVDVDEDITNRLDRLSWLIIINQNMNTLPFRINVEGDSSEIEPIFPKGIIASQSELNLNFFENNLRLEYRWLGPDYVSLANSTVRRDVAGYSLTDRFQLFDNSLYVTLGYENLNDNVIGNKDATTHTNTVRTNVSWFPAEQHYPQVSVGLMFRNRDNEVALFNPYLETGIMGMNTAVRNFEIIGVDTVLASNPRLTKTVQLYSSVSREFEFMDMTHDASINISFLNTRDEYFRYGDTRNSSVSFNIRSNVSTIPMQTNIGFSINNTETLGGLSDINIFGFNVGGSMFLLDDKMNISADLAFTKNRTYTTPLVIDDFGTSDPRDDLFVPETDFFGNRITEEVKNNLYILRAGATYNLNANHAFMVNFSYTNVTNRISDINTPNDHMLQAQYIYRF